MTSKDRLLRSSVLNLLAEGKIKISAEYMKKEAIRADIQKQLMELIQSGSITSQEEASKWLEEYKSTVDMAVGALKMVPIEAFQKKSAKK